MRKSLENEQREALYQRAEEAVDRDEAEEAARKIAAGKSAQGKATKSFRMSALVTSMAGKPKDATREEDEEDWPTQLEKIKERMRSAGLPFCDPSGRNILPSEPPRKAIVEVYVTPQIMDGALSASDNQDSSPLECKIRFWHRDFNGERTNLLGMVHLTKEVCPVVILYTCYQTLILCFYCCFSDINEATKRHSNIPSESRL